MARKDDERTPPSKTRVTGLQEHQLPDLVKVDEACSAMYDAIGLDAAEVPRRSVSDIVALQKRNSLKVAEADGEVAGLLAWHDESPGVAYLADLQVHPDYQRFGVGSTLLEAMREEARGLRLEQIVVRAWEKATWAMGFYKRHRFQPIDATAPAKVQSWKEERLQSGKPLVRPGEVVLWAPVGLAPKILTDDDMDMTLVTGEIPPES